MRVSVVHMYVVSQDNSYNAWLAVTCGQWYHAMCLKIPREVLTKSGCEKGAN